MRLVKHENIDGNSAWVEEKTIYHMDADLLTEDITTVHFRTGERIYECPVCESEEFVRTTFISKHEHELKCVECNIEFVDLLT